MSTQEEKTSSFTPNPIDLEATILADQVRRPVNFADAEYPALSDQSAKNLIDFAKKNPQAANFALRKAAELNPRRH